MRTADFDFLLPLELIAQTPAAERDQSRLLVLQRSNGQIAHRHFGDLLEYLRPGDLLVLNHQGKESYLLGVNRRDGRTVWKTDRSKYQYGWSTPVYWRHDGVDEIAVLGGDFQPNQRLMAYSLADGAERWWRCRYRR